MTPRIQDRADDMMARYGFLGVPRETFEIGGQAQLTRLIDHGLTRESRVLEIGCGCLRVACRLIPFLEPHCYFGIEPARQRVEYGLQYLFMPGEIGRKQ